MFMNIYNFIYLFFFCDLNIFLEKKEDALKEKTIHARLVTQDFN